MLFWDKIKKTGALFTVIMTTASIASVIYGYHKIFIIHDVQAAFKKEFVEKNELNILIQKIDLTREDLRGFRKESKDDIQEIRSYLLRNYKK